MNLPNGFEYYLQKRIARKVIPDKPRAEFLIKESETSLEGLKERIKIIGINNKNSNSIIKDCYDIIMELIRAKLLLDGYSASGNYAHESEISYLKKLGFSDSEISFLNELRYFRNSVTYYGKILDKEYAEKVYTFLNNIVTKLNELLRNKKIEKICIIKLGALGDVVRTLPIAKALKQTDRESEIIWVTKENALGLFEANPYVDEVFVIGSDLSDKKFDVLYNFDIEEEACELAKEIKADVKFGFYFEEGYPMAFNPEAEYYINSVFDDALKKENRKTYQRMMFETAGLVWDNSQCEIFLKDDEKKKAKAFLKKQGRDEKKKLIGLHIGASKRWPSKVWHSDRVEEFIKLISERGYEVMLFAGLDEKEKQAEIKNQMEKEGVKILFNNPDNSIREFAGLVNECSCMVCGDSFSLHAALALEKKTIGLFFCTSPHEIEGYGLLKKVIASRLWEVFPEKMDVYDEELVKSISAEEVAGEVEGELRDNAQDKLKSILGASKKKTSDKELHKAGV